MHIQRRLSSGFCIRIGSGTRARFVFAVLGALVLLNTAPLAQSDADNPPGRVARISYLKGSVSFLPAGQTQWSEATMNYVVTTGDRLYTDRGARAELEIGPYTVRLWEQTDLTVTNLNDQVMQLGLNQGSLRVSVDQLPEGNTVEIDTPNGALNVQQKGTYRADVDPNANRTLVEVNNGRLEVTGDDVSETVESGQAALLTGQNPPQVALVDMPARDDFDQWSEDRDQRLRSSGSAKYVNSFAVGYADLDAYGSWAMVADYGPVWYPTVGVGWVPYRFGRWVWIDPWGWTWMEDEAWGFCPFHYGRWVLIGTAWGWLPGPIVMAPIYAPAFVAFLGGPGFSIGVGTGMVGWFPLGPADPFFPWYHHSGTYIQQVNVTNVRVTNINNTINTTNINDIHYAYKPVATTAVPANVFSNGEPVAHHVVRLSPEQLARAQVIPHPPANPTPRAAAPGKPVKPPAVRPAQFVAAKRIASAAARPSPGQHPGPTPPSKVAPRPPATAASARPPVAVPSRPEARPIPPPLVVRRPPPPPVVPFEERQRAMSDHPGRPLEPRQIENLRTGRPPGPMFDREFPPHPAPAVREPRPRSLVEWPRPPELFHSKEGTL